MLMPKYCFNRIWSNVLVGARNNLGPSAQIRLCGTRNLLVYLSDTISRSWLSDDWQ